MPQALPAAQRQPIPAQRAPSIAALLQHCSPSTQKATLRALALAARSEDRQEWDKHFGRVLILVLDSLFQKEPQGLRETALLCLQELVSCQSSFFNDFAEVVATKLLETYRSCGPVEAHTAAMVDRTLERLLGAVDASRAMEILVPIVNAETAPLLQMATRLMSVVLRRMQPQEVLAHLEMIFPGVVAALSSPNPDVRKAAVFCLVDVYISLGEQAMPLLSKELTPSQMKLVTLYVSRQQREKGSSPGPPIHAEDGGAA